MLEPSVDPAPDDLDGCRAPKPDRESLREANLRSKPSE
jgi:hypothetical protein